MNMSSWIKYVEANFDTIWQLRRIDGYPKWCVGFFRHGEDSLDNDGLICFAEVDGINKEYCLSKVCDSIEEAVDTSYVRWKQYNQGGFRDEISF